MAFGVTRNRLAWLLLAPLLVVILYAAFVAQSHTCPSVDCRTYVEMVRGISDHGLPYLENGPVALYPELQARWNVVHGDRLWGTYPPVFPYAAVIPFRLGGLVGVAHFNGLMLAVLAFGVFALGRRYTRDSLAGTAAAYIVVLSTPAGASSLDLGPYTMAVSMITWASFFTIWALDEADGRARRLALVAGLLGGLALGTHLLNLPLLGALLLVLCAVPVGGSPTLLPERFRQHRFAHLAPTRASMRRGVWAIVGAGLPLSGMAALNHLRFGSWNPISYGPCAWRSCDETGLGHQSAGAMLLYAAMTIVWATLTIGVSWYVRRSRIGLMIAALGSLAFLFGYEPLTRHTRNIATIFWAYLVDNSPFDMFPMSRPPDGLGNMFGPFVIKSTLQCTPFLALAAMAPFTSRREKGVTLALGLPALALFVLLGLRANLVPVHALGYPFLYLRYVLPALPLLVVLGLEAVKALPWTWAHVVLAAGATLAFVVALNQAPDDMLYWRRVLVLRGTLALGGGALILGGIAHRSLGKAWKRAAAFATVGAIACGIAITSMIDLRVVLSMQKESARRVDHVALIVPQRFALAGWAGDIDLLLSLRATRDIEYVDLYESLNWYNFRQMIDRWSSDHRPIFAVLPPGAVKSPWQDVDFELVDPAERLYRVTKRIP